MTQAVELLVLVQRLRREAARQGDSELAIDLRLACRHLRRYAAQWIALEAERTRDLGAQRRPNARGGRLVEAMNLGRNRRSLSASRDDHSDLSLDKIKYQRLYPIVPALRPAILNDNVVAIKIPDFLQAPTETGDEMSERGCRRRAEEADHRHRRLLRPRRKRPPSRRTAE